MPKNNIYNSGLKTDTFTTPSQGPAPSGVDPAQWDANPYANLDYRHTWWQKLLEGIGIRTNYDAFRESMAVNAAEYNSQLMEKAHNEQYDSPAAQNARLRAAGINPDLAGETSSGSSSPMEPDPNAPIAPEASNFQAFGQFTNMIMSGFTSAIGLANQITGMIGNVEDIVSKRNSNRMSVVNDAISWTMRQIPAFMPIYHGEKSDRNPFFTNGLFEDDALDYALASGYRRKDAKLFSRTVRDYLKSAPGEADAYKAWYDTGMARIDANSMYGSDLWSESDETLRAVLDPIIKANDRVRNLRPVVEGEQLDTAGAQAAYEGARFNELNGELAGQVENTTNERNLHSANIDSILNECMDEIISNLKDKSESGRRGHNFATAALLIFSVLRMTNFHPTFSSSSASGSTPWGATSSKSHSFGF